FCAVTEAWIFSREASLISSKRCDKYGCILNDHYVFIKIANIIIQTNVISRKHTSNHILNETLMNRYGKYLPDRLVRKKNIEARINFNRLRRIHSELPHIDIEAIKANGFYKNIGV